MVLNGTSHYGGQGDQDLISSDGVSYDYFWILGAVGGAILVGIVVCYACAESHHGKVESL